MSLESRRMAGILLVIFPTVIYGGVSLLGMLAGGDAGYVDNSLRQDLFRAGHAHAGVILILSLVALRYIDEAALGEGLKKLLRTAIPSAAILLPVGFFLSILRADATHPNGMIYFAYAGAVVLAAALLTLGIGLLKGAESRR